jgi:leucyl/phenylalanyl-tRNA--protein transferase
MTTSIYWLDADTCQFPDYSYALSEPNGLLAAGGDLSPERIINAYALGIFPWFNEDDPILWWCPDPRSILIPRDFSPSRSLVKFMRNTEYKITFNQCFSDVMELCAAPRTKQDGTWINEDMVEAYSQLNELGYAHSVEYWRNGKLEGGLYGLSIGKAFFGESMFSLSANASKVAFSHLCDKLNKHDFELIDCQVHSPHLESLGAFEVPRHEFLQLLQDAICKPETNWPNE